MLRPDAGDIFFDGKPWTRERLAETGVLIEQPPLYENLTARENLEVRRLLLGLPKKRIEDVLETVDLTNTGKKRAGQFSLGMVCNVGLGLIGGSTDMWMLNPFYYSNRLMCPLLGILPNGLPAVPESMYYFEGALDMSVIPVGVILSIVLFALTFAVTVVWYQRKGIKGWEN